MCPAFYNSNSLYALLNVAPTADDKQIRTAYRQAALRSHPDKGGSAEAFHSVVAAFEVLSCPVSRRLYDFGCHPQCQPGQQRCTTDPVAAGLDSSRFNFQSAGDHAVGIATNPKPRRPRVREVPKRMARKRSCPSAGHKDQKVKQQRSIASAAHRIRMAALGVQQHKQQAFQHLRDILQSMIAQNRYAAIQSLDSRVKHTLLCFMKKAKDLQGVGGCPKRCANATFINCSLRPKSTKFKADSKQLPLSGLTGVRAIAASHYRARIDVKALRMYTRAHAKIESAIEQHIVLVQIRQALRQAELADAGVWHQPARLYDISQRVMECSGLTEHELGLCVFVSFRADQWLGRGYHITSPVMSLRAALELHSRMLVARQTSWEALRSECVKLMLHKTRFMRQGLSAAAAEIIVDAARQKALQSKFVQAKRRAVAALKRMELMSLSAAKQKARVEVQQQRQRLRRAAASARKSKQDEFLRTQRLRWLRRSDLTAAELLQGLPPRLNVDGA